jgi:small basic protein (TIGR04137 family)
MSIDRSLRVKSSLVRHRNVLTRAERVMTLMDQDKWDDRETALHLPKVANLKPRAGGKKKAKGPAGEEGEESK